MILGDPRGRKREESLEKLSEEIVTSSREGLCKRFENTFSWKEILWNREERTCNMLPRFMRNKSVKRRRKLVRGTKYLFYTFSQKSKTAADADNSQCDVINKHNYVKNWNSR